MSVLGDLRSATWPCHQRLEKRLDVKRRFSEPAAYRAHLEKMWGFCAALERRVDGPTLGDALPDYERRRKLPLLARDLQALGAPAAEAPLPLCPGLPECAHVAQAFGSLYVIEGATLGARVLAPVVEQHLGLGRDCGAAYLAGYGEDTERMWHTFGRALEAWCFPPARRAQAQAAAIAVFAALERWLCGPGA